MKFDITKEAADKIKSIKAEYKDRGLTRTQWSSVLSGLIESANDKQVYALIEKHTPDRYYIESAIKDPSLKSSLVERIKKDLKRIEQSPAQEG